MNNRLHYQKISIAFEDRKDPLSIVYSDRKGHIVTGQCVITSSHFRPCTVNVRFIDSGEVRKLRCIRIIQINNTDIYA